MHNSFVAAFYALGSDAAVPKKILEVRPPLHSMWQSAGISSDLLDLYIIWKARSLTY